MDSEIIVYCIGEFLTIERNIVYSMGIRLIGGYREWTNWLLRLGWEDECFFRELEELKWNEYAK